MTNSRMIIFAAIGFLASVVSIAPATAQTCKEQIKDLVDLIGPADKIAAEDNSPMIVTMADGREVDLRGAPAAKPFENWFGDPIKRKEMEGRIVQAQASAESEKNEICMIEIGKLKQRLEASAPAN